MKADLGKPVMAQYWKIKADVPVALLRYSKDTMPISVLSSRQE